MLLKAVVYLCSLTAILSARCKIGQAAWFASRARLLLSRCDSEASDKSDVNKTAEFPLRFLSQTLDPFSLACPSQHRQAKPNGSEQS